MTDLLGSIGDTIGDVAQGAYDFVVPQTDRRGEGFSLGNALSSLEEAVSFSPVGAIARIPDIIKSNDGWGTKLLLSGAIAAGGYMSARHLFGAQKLEQEIAERGVVRYADPARSRPGLNIGLRQRYVPSTPEGVLAQGRFPGIKARTADVLGAKDVRAMIPHLIDAQDQLERDVAGGIVAQYSSRLLDVEPQLRFGAAQADWAKFHAAIDGKLTVGDRNSHVTGVWKKFTTAPSSLSDEEALLLQDHVQQLGDLTRGIIEPDMTFDMASKVTQIDFTPAGIEMHITSPTGWNDGRSVNAKVRSARLKELNLRALAGRAERILHQLIDEGLADPDRFLERTDDWYRNVADEIAARLPEVQKRHPWLDGERFTAAVSLTSEATDWDQNIPMAEAALDMLLKVPPEDGELFQRWLAGESVPGASRFERLFQQLHDEVTAKDATRLWKVRQSEARVAWNKIPAKNRPKFEEYFTEKSPGNFLSTKDLKKVMRLATISGEEVFASMPGAPKQKSFYLNMLDPSNPDPVTVDRHAYDIFFGLATHSDFKGLEGLNLSESNYEIIADVYRKVARDRKMLPNQVQGITWQTWRVKKDEWNPLTHNWEGGRGPFRLDEPDGTPNIVWETLNGRPNPGLKDVYSVLPERLVWVTGGEGQGPYILPDGSAGLAMRHTREVADQYRALYPAITRQDGVSLYMRGEARRVQDVAMVERQLADQLKGGYVTERSSASSWGGVHPAEANTELIVFEAADDASIPSDFRGRLIGAGEPALVDAPTGVPVGLRQVDLDEFLRARKFLNEAKVQKGGTTADQMLSRLPDDPVSEWADHRFWLNEDGSAGFAIAPDGDLQQVFNSSPVKGYGSQMVTYAKAQGATKLDFYDGEFLPDGTVGPGYLKEFYSKHGFEPTERYEWDPEYDYLNRPVGPPVQMMQLGEGANVPPSRETRTVRRYAIQPTAKELADIEKVAGKLEAAGLKIHGIYAPGAPPAGWRAAREHLYSDGVNRLAVRTADGETISPHGFGVWVREADHVNLPKENPLGSRYAKERVEPKLNGGVYNYAGMATGSVDIFDPKVRAFSVSFGPYGDSLPSFQAMIGATPVPYDGALSGMPGGRRFTPGTVRKIGDRFVITATDPQNITDDVRTYNLLVGMGVPKSKVTITVGEEAARVGVNDATLSKKPVQVVMGYDTHPLRRTSLPLPDLRNKYGTLVEPSARRPQDGRLATLADEHIPHIDAGLAAFYSDPVRAEIAKMAGWERISLSFDAPKGPGSFGWYYMEHGGAIALGGGHFAEAGKLFQNLRANQLDNHMNPRLEPNATAILGHEMGHMLHNGVMLSFRTKGAANEWMKSVRKVADKLGKKGVIREVSKYASGDIDEFIAELMAEAIMAPNPSALSREVYAMLTEQFKANQVPQSGRTFGGVG